MKRTMPLLAALALLTPLAAHAQFETGRRPGGDQGGQQRPAWEEFKLDAKKRVQLSFRNASVDAIVELLSRVSGVTILKDPSLTQAMTLTSPKSVPLKEAFSIFNSALGLRGYEMAKDGSVMVIRRRQERPQGMNSDAIAAMMRAGQQAQSELKVYRIKFASATEVARVVNEVFQQQQQMQLGGGFPMMFGGGAAGRFGGGNRFGGGGGGFSFPGMGGQSPNVRASSDDFSNSVIVNAPKDKQLEVETLIEDIDKQTDQPLQTKTYRLTYATALDVVSVVQGVLQANAPRGRGGPSNQSLNQRFSFASFFGGGNQSGQSSVTAEDRSNSLIVSTTADNQKIVEALIKDLDQEVPVVNTTFVFPLKNARADSVATILQGAFGNRNGGGTGNRGGTGTNRTGTNNRNTGRNTGNQLGGATLGGRAAEGDTNSLNIPMDPDKADENILMTDVWVQQGGFRFGAQNNQGGRTQSGLTRTADGRVVNQRDLTNQVTVIPDPNTNSLVIVTTPDNVEVLQSILGQLDRIPEQVMIETMIIEATLDKGTKLGVEWNVAQPKAFNQTGVTGDARSDFGLQNANPLGQGFRYTVTGGNISAFINALKTDNKFEVLSTPRIFTSNNVEGVINISQRVPYVVSQREDANGNLTFNYDFEDVGIVLTVTPRITSNGYVTMEITQTANDLQGYTDFNAPIINQRQAETTVSVKDGETIVLGGIMRTQVNAKIKKLPLLGDIPILGELFKSTERTNTKTELLVFLKPTVIRDEDEARALREKTQSELSPGLKDKVEKNILNGSSKPTSKKSDKGNKVSPPKPGETGPAGGVTKP